MENIVEIEVISKGTKRSSNACNDILFFDEAEICINKDGTLNVAAEKFAPEKIILKFDRLFSDKAIMATHGKEDTEIFCGKNLVNAPLCPGILLHPKTIKTIVLV